MTPRLITDSLTLKQINFFKKRPSHALGIVGPVGSGKLALATQMASDLLEITELSSYPYNLIIEPKPKLGIDEIRQLNEFLRLKVPRPGQITRSVIIENAQSMTLEAQNALLKTLEEPPANSLVIMTITSTSALLPTIYSRLQFINVKKPDKQQLEDYFRTNYSSAAIDQTYIVSGGLPGLMATLLKQPEHPLMEATNEARTWLKSNQYERFLMIDRLSRHKELTIDMLYIFERMAHVSLQTASGNNVKRWQIIMESAIDAEKALEQNAQSKLVLANLALAF